MDIHLNFHRHDLIGYAVFLALAILALPLYGNLFAEEAALSPRLDAEVSGKIFRVVLVPQREATLSAEASAKVLKLNFLLGKSFKSGEELLAMEDTFYLAALEKSRAMLKAATLKLDTLTDLRSRNDASVTELEDARRDVASAQAESALAKRNFSACHLTAPYDGRVADVFINEYELVEPGRPLLRIIDDNVLLGHVFLPGSIYPKIKDAQRIAIRIEWTGQVASSQPNADQAKSASLPPAKQIPDSPAQAPAPANAKPAEPAQQAPPSKPASMPTNTKPGQTAAAAPPASAPATTAAKAPMPQPAAPAPAIIVEGACAVASGEVCRISPVIDPASGMFEIYVRIDNAAGLFRAGMEAWIVAEELNGK